MEIPLKFFIYALKDPNTKEIGYIGLSSTVFEQVPDDSL
jgi:hypothetical protein